MTPTLIDSILSEVFDALFQELRFEKVGSRRYVRTRIRSVREVVEFRSNDVVVMLPTWGFSFDFVPHVAGRHTETIRWHRTPKNTFRDLWFSGMNRSIAHSSEPELGARLQLLQGEQRFREDALVTKNFLFPKIIRQLSEPRELRAFRRLFEAEEQKLGRAFYNYSQLVLAFAFYLAKTGEAEPARWYMSQWLPYAHYREETQSKITDLFEAALRSPITIQ